MASTAFAVNEFFRKFRLFYFKHSYPPSIPLNYPHHWTFVHNIKSMFNPLGSRFLIPIRMNIFPCGIIFVQKSPGHFCEFYQRALWKKIPAVNSSSTSFSLLSRYSFSTSLSLQMRIASCIAFLVLPWIDTCSWHILVNVTYWWIISPSFPS